MNFPSDLKLATALLYFCFRKHIYRGLAVGLSTLSGENIRSPTVVNGYRIPVDVGSGPREAGQQTWRPSAGHEAIRLTAARHVSERYWSTTKA